MFHIRLNGQRVISHSFLGGDSVPATSGSFSDGTYTAQTIQTGEIAFGNRNSIWADGIHHYTLIFNSTATALNLGFEIDTDDPFYNESFGLDNVVVTTNSGAVVETEDFEDGPGEGWNTNIWYSNPQVATIRTGALGFRAGGFQLDGIHRFNISIPTAAERVTLGFGDTLDEDVSTESFGIDNLQVVELVESCSQ